MKLSSKILSLIVMAAIIGMLVSNFLLKKEYDGMDKSDLYWTYEKVLQQPFKYLRIKGGNFSNIAYEQNDHCSVRISHAWVRYHGGSLNPVVKNDTLIIDFNFVPTNTFEKFWMRSNTTIRIFSPELLAIDGSDTNFTMFKMKQRNYNVRLAGRSSFEVESMIRSLDSINVSQRDSSEVVFEMSPEYKATVEVGNRLAISAGGNAYKPQVNLVTAVKNKDALILSSLAANIQGSSVLDVGHAQIGALKLNISDSSAILLSGGALRKLKQ